MTEHVVTEAMKAQVEGQNGALDFMPTDLQVRADAIRLMRLKRDEEAKAVKKAKEDAQEKVGATAMEKRLIKEYGWRKLALKTLESLAKITDPFERGATARQIFEGMKLEGHLIPELFDEEREGKKEGQSAAAADKPVFDNTPQGSKAKGLTPIEKAAQAPAPTPKPTPAVDLRVATATLELNNYLAARPYTKGAKTKEHKALLTKLEEANALAISDPEGGKAPVAETPPSLEVPGSVADPVSGLPDVNPGAPSDAELPELPAAAEGSVSQEIASGVAESQAHIESQIPVKPKRQTAAQKKAAEKKAAEDGAAPQAPAGASAAPVAGPDGPDDDEEESPFAPVPSLAATKPTPIGGRAPASTRLG